MNTFYRLTVAALVAVVLTTQTSAAQELQNQDDADPINVGTVLVQGKQPGPKLWRIQNGENTLWVLGTVDPLPKGLDWDSGRVENLIQHSQEIIWLPSVNITLSGSFMDKVRLGLKIFQLGKNEDGKTLKDVLPPGIYAKWLSKKSQYLAKNSSVDRARPIFAAQELYSAALKRIGLVNGNFVKDPILKAAKTNKVKVTTPKVVKTIKDPKRIPEAIAQLSHNDAKCLDATIDAIDHDLPLVSRNAVAWATGDIFAVNVEKLRQRDTICTDVILDSDFSKILGLGDLQSEIRQVWINQAMASLSRNVTTIAVLPISNINGPNSFIKALESKGYKVTAPSR